MTDPTTRRSTPPQSKRIGQPSTSSSTILPAYDDESFPQIAFTNQLAIDTTTKTLAYYDTNGGWQGVLGASDRQSFYGPTAPTTPNLNPADRWYNTTTGVWNLWNDTAAAWMPGNAAYSTTAPTAPTTGQAWFDQSTQTLYFYNGTAWVLGTDVTAPGVYSSGSLPTAANQGSTWTDAHGVQYVCNHTYVSAPLTSYWTQITIGADPLVNLISQNGQLVQAQEASAPATNDPSMGPSTQAAITTGLVWHDDTTGSPFSGNYYVYNGSAWQVVTNPSTLVLCSGLRVSQTASGIIGTNLNYIWPDPLAALISATSSFALGTGSANSAATGPVILANVANVAVSNNLATLDLDNTTQFIATRSVVIAGLAGNPSLNGTWTIQQVLDATDQITFTTGLANIAPVADPGTATLPFQVGDVAQDTVDNDFWVWDANTATGTWADWLPVTPSSPVVALCATIATQVLPTLISQRCITVGQDVALGQFQSVAADLNAALLDLVALSDAAYQGADPALDNYAFASGSWIQDSVMVFTGQDLPGLANIGPVGLNLMNTSSASDAQDIISVTDSGWTGTAAKIQAANFLATYTTARGTFP